MKSDENDLIYRVLCFVLDFLNFYLFDFPIFSPQPNGIVIYVASLFHFILFLVFCNDFVLSVDTGPRSIMNIEETSKKRPFFTSPEDVFDEEYYDEQMPEKKRRLTPEQVCVNC